MKKITTLFLAAAMLCGAASTQAVDFKAQGEWVMSFEGGAGGSLTEDGYGNAGEDNFSARQRVRLQLEAVASEALSGTVYFQIGDQTWGNAEEGGALGADGRMVNVKQAYVDWLVPNTDLKLRMGLQGVSLPSFAGQQFSFDEDHSTAGIVASYKFTENVALTGMWLRLYNDNFTDTRADGRSGSNAHAQDNVDLFGLVLPLTFALHPAERERVEAFHDSLSALGFDLVLREQLEVRAVPPLLERAAAGEFIREVLAGRKEDLRSLWASMACKAAIKAGDELAADEAVNLIAQWLMTKNRQFCPHGRPCVLQWNVAELDKLFKRLG